MQIFTYLTVTHFIAHAEQAILSVVKTKKNKSFTKASRKNKMS